MYVGSLAAVSNRETWTVPVEVMDTDNVAVDITGATIVVAVTKPGDGSATLTAEVGDGVTITNATGGVFEWTFSVDDMNELDAGTYNIGVTITIDDVTTQLISGFVPVLDGVVAA